MRRGDQSVTETCKCSAGHADWGMLTGRHPAPHQCLNIVTVMTKALLFLSVRLWLTNVTVKKKAFLVNR